MPETTTVCDLLTLSGSPAGRVELGFDLLTSMRCISCGQSEPIFQPLERSSSSLIFCPACGQETRQPETVHWLDRESEGAGTPLSRFGLPPYSALAVKAEETRQFFQLGGEFRF